MTTQPDYAAAFVGELLEKNARIAALEAANADLLAILERIARPFPDGCNWEDQARACQAIAQQIVAKAKGEQP